ncbi:MAG: ATP-binding protein [Prolixibacteraceae bacterium]|nr:ATP-binding protein [Prolixibacteraceae bacterium]
MVLLLACSVASVSAFPASDGIKNVLLINSYHQGLAWTDSLTAGIVKTFKNHPNYNLFIEYLNSKQFGKSNFEIEKEYFQKKYSGIQMDGLLVTDNDALDFVIQYEKTFFPDVPVVFAGISNPEDYSLEGSRYYGLKESGSNENVVGFIRNLLPNSKRLLIITDLTTTGLIYRKEFLRQAQVFKDFTILFPEVIDLDTIYRMVSSENDYDAIYYIGISQDKNGRLVDPMPLVKQICLRAKVPVFTNDPIYNGVGIVGGLFQSGKRHGAKSVDLLINLLNKKPTDTFQHVYIEGQSSFFDHKMLDKYNISAKKLPLYAVIINQKTLFDKENFGVLFIVLVVLSFIVVVLSVVNRRRKNKQKRTNNQLREIESQKLELEEAQEQLSRVILELENANGQLQDTNVKLMEAKKKAEESDNLKSAFLANVSHEIRTPLNSIVGFSSLLSEPDLSDETKKIYIDLVESNTESLLVLIDEIIDLSKIEAQQLTLKKQIFSIDSLMSELFQIFSQTQNNPNVELRMKKLSDDKELIVNSDRIRIRQIFINLLSNAAKFTNNGFIEFGYREDDIHGIVLFVKDTGIGISKEYHKAVFHRFRKLNENSGKVFRGTGLGLAITQKLVELLGGKIWLESELGKGSTFYFTLDGLTMNDISS